MKRFEPIYLFLLFILTLNACKTDKGADEVLTININGIEDNSPINYSQVFGDYRIIPLYSSGDSVLGAINELVISKDKIIVFDERIYKGVLIFDKNGHVISGVRNKGRGPGEYVNVSGIDIDTISQQIFIFDWPHKICVYNFNGDFVKDIKVKNGFTDLAFFNSKLYLCNTTKAEPTLLVTNQAGKVLSSIDDPIALNRWTGITGRITGDIFKYQEMLYLSFPYDKIIYSIEDSKLTPQIIIEDEEFGNPLEIVKLTRNNQEEYMESMRNRVTLRSFSRNENLIFFQITPSLKKRLQNKRLRPNQYFHIIDKSKTIGSYLKDDMTFASPEMLQLSGDQMITCISSANIFPLKEKIAKGTITVPKKLDDELSKINYDNYYPLLIIYDIKEEFEFYREGL